MVDNMAELVYRKMGAKIRYYRKLKGINQTDFAIKVSISSQYLSKIENGKRIPSLPVLLSIAEALEVEVAELLDGKKCVKSLLVVICMVSNFLYTLTETL